MIEDAVVVGAGPAGSAAAAELARRGVGVALLDARAFPRSKPCGDCVSPGALPLLGRLGAAERVRALRPARLGGWRVRTPGGKWFGGRFLPGRGTGPSIGWSLPREELDAAILEAAVSAGAEFRPGIRAVGLLRDGPRVSGVRARDGDGRAMEIPARVVIGADGLRSTVARRLGPVRRGARDRLALVVRLRAPRPPGENGTGPRGTGATASAGQMRLGRDGCLGLAPVGDGRWNACLVVPRAEARAVSRDRWGYFRRRIAGYGAGEWLAEADPAAEMEITGPFEVSPRRRAAPGVLLAGDAAGYFDPLTGQGIHRALVSGRLAGGTAAEIVRRPRREGAALVAYRRRLREATGPCLALQRWIDRAVTRPALIERLGRLLSARPGLASLLFEATGDRISPDALLDPRVLLPALRGGGPSSNVSTETHAHP